MKKIISFISALFIVFAFLSFSVAFADNTSKQKVEDIIAGKQDFLVLANIIEKGTSSYEVQVIEEINIKGKDEEKKSIEGDRINVLGFKNYMYYDSFDYRPQKGDNVLLSLESRGNMYGVKNGAYLVDSASHEQLKFKVPDVYNGTQEALEINALYIYVHSNGEINNLTVKKNGIYGKDANGEDMKIEAQGGIVFIDEYGDQTENPTAPVERYDGNSSYANQSKWHIVLLILVFGSLIGLGVVKMVRKFEKRYEE
ncbi:MAG: hypothetical protein J6R68_07425 [Clostridia bacterium]|nr:hypothetical protein [Clostridia bacterium]MBO7288782.1 hypothetical protein [Clostridia bacterium]